MINQAQVLSFVIWIYFIFIFGISYEYIFTKTNIVYFLTKAVTVESMEKIAAYLVDSVLSRNNAITSMEHVWTVVTVATKVFFVQKVRIYFNTALYRSTKLDSTKLPAIIFEWFFFYF